MLDVTESEQDVCVLARREHNWFRCVGKLERHVRQFIDPAVTITIPPSGSRKRTLRDFGCCSTGLKLGNKLKATRTTTRDEGEKSEGNSDSQQNEKCKKTPYGADVPSGVPLHTPSCAAALRIATHDSFSRPINEVPVSGYAAHERHSVSC